MRTKFAGAGSDGVAHFMHFTRSCASANFHDLCDSRNSGAGERHIRRNFGLVYLFATYYEQNQTCIPPQVTYLDILVRVIGRCDRGTK
jgi:hypothetical protein